MWHKAIAGRCRTNIFFPFLRFHHQQCGSDKVYSFPHQQCGREGVLISTVSSWREVVSLSTTSGMDIRVYPFSPPALSTCRVYPFPSPAVWLCRVYQCTVDVQGVPIPPPDVWTCRVYPPTPSAVCIHLRCKQCRHAGDIPFHRQQYRGAGCILLHPCTMFFNARLYGIQSVCYQYALKCRCREQSGTGIRSIEMAVYCTGVDHGLLDL
jgi:hypothetical protein